MSKFDFEEYAETGFNLDNLGVQFGVPNCLLTMGKALMDILPAPQMGQIKNALTDGLAAANEWVSVKKNQIFDQNGIFEVDTFTGKVRMRTGYGLNETGEKVSGFIGNIQGLLSGGFNLYQNVAAPIDQVLEMLDCIDKFDQMQQGQKEANTGPSQIFAEILVPQIRNARDFVLQAEAQIENINTVFRERKVDPTREPVYNTSAGVIRGNDLVVALAQSLLLSSMDEPAEAVFDLIFGPPISKKGQFILSKDGLYYDSQSGGLPEVSGFVNPGDRWKLLHDPNLGGKGEIITLASVSKFVDTVFDLNIIDDSKFLEPHYNGDNFLQTLIGQKAHNLFDLSGDVTTLIASGYDPNSAVVINYNNSIHSIASKFDEKINKRKKQIEIAVKLPQIFATSAQFSPGEVPINDFSYLAGTNIAPALEAQQKLIFRAGEVSAVVLPIQTRFVRAEDSLIVPSMNHLLVSPVDKGGIIYDTPLEAKNYLTYTENFIFDDAHGGSDVSGGNWIPGCSNSAFPFYGYAASNSLTVSSPIGTQPVQHIYVIPELSGATYGCVRKAGNGPQTEQGVFGLTQTLSVYIKSASAVTTTSSTTFDLFFHDRTEQVLGGVVEYGARWAFSSTPGELLELFGGLDSNDVSVSSIDDDWYRLSVSLNMSSHPSALTALGHTRNHFFQIVSLDQSTPPVSHVDRGWFVWGIQGEDNSTVTEYQARYQTGFVGFNGSAGPFTLGLNDKIECDKLIAVYNFLNPTVGNPGSTDFNLVNSYVNQDVNPNIQNARLVSKDQVFTFDKGLSIPYLRGIANVDSSASVDDVNSTNNLTETGSYIQLPDTEEYRNLTYNLNGFSMDFWTWIPSLSTSGNLFDYTTTKTSPLITAHSQDGWDITSGLNASSLSRLFLSCENTGGVNQEQDANNVLPDFGSDVVRGLVYGITVDPQIINDDNTPLLALSATNTVGLLTSGTYIYIAPTQSVNASDISYISRDTECLGVQGYFNFKFPTSSVVSNVSLSSMRDQFVHLVLTVNPRKDEITLYADGVQLVTSSLATSFGTIPFAPLQLPSFKKPNSFEYNTSSTGNSVFADGPQLGAFFTPWIVGGGYTDGMVRVVSDGAWAGGFMGTNSGRISALRGFMGSLKFYAKALNSTEVKKNYDAQSPYFKNIETYDGGVGI